MLETNVQPDGVCLLDGVVEPVLAQFHVPELEVGNQEGIVGAGEEFHVLHPETVCNLFRQIIGKFQGRTTQEAAFPHKIGGLADIRLIGIPIFLLIVFRNVQHREPGPDRLVFRGFFRDFSAILTPPPLHCLACDSPPDI